MCLIKDNFNPISNGDNNSRDEDSKENKNNKFKYNNNTINI